MRKGAKRRDWSVEEERYLAASAGRVPKRDICLKLRRSSKSVERKAAAMRAAGADVDLRCYRPSLSPCPRCGCMSGTIDRRGLCEPCRRREQLAAIQSRIAAMLPRLPAAERAVYARTESMLESHAEPLPEAPDTSGMSRWRRAYREEAHALAVERAVERNLRREVKAAQKRKERIQKKLKSMGVTQIGAQK